MSLVGEPLWVRIFTSGVIVAWMVAWFRLFWYWKEEK
jgi:hypothetical protein